MMKNTVKDTEIIRCKECKFAHLTSNGECKYCDHFVDDNDNPIELYVSENFYCGFAEKK